MPLSRVVLRILIDNNENPTMHIRTGWGLSIHVDADGHRFLFDTGPSASLLEENSRLLHVDLTDIEACIISHMHGDHIGGLEYVAKRNPRRRIPLYLPEDSRASRYYEGLGFDTRVSLSPATIRNGVMLSGVFRDHIAEQCVVLDVERFGLLLLVGCSHPGIDRIAKSVMERMDRPIGGILGGWHLNGLALSHIRKIVEELVALKPRFLAPIHCSGNLVRELLRRKYPEVFLDVYVGSRIQIVNGEVKISNDIGD